MVAVEGGEPAPSGFDFWIPLLAPDAGNDLAADAVDRRLVETWRGKGKPHQVQRLILLVGKHAHGSVDIVTARAKANFGACIVEARLERIAVELTGALVEQPGHEVDQPLLAGGILRLTTGEGKTQRDDRDRIVLDQPGRNATIRTNFLNFHRCLRGNADNQREKAESRCKAGI